MRRSISGAVRNCAAAPPTPTRWASSASSTSLDDLPPDKELDTLIFKAAELAKAAPAPRQTKHAPKPPPELHPEFAAALAKSPKAKAALDGFPPSAQRDYFEWISEAKQPATRAKRIATAVEWLNEGKRRHWKYQDC